MSSNLNIRFPDGMRQFIDTQANAEGLYDSAEEYIRDLVRKDFERVEAEKWKWLDEQILAGINADISDFKPLTKENIFSDVDEQES